MSNWYTIIARDVSKIPEAIKHFETELQSREILLSDLLPELEFAKNSVLRRCGFSSHYLVTGRQSILAIPPDELNPSELAEQVTLQTKLSAAA